MISSHILDDFINDMKWISIEFLFVQALKSASIPQVPHCLHSLDCSTSIDPIDMFILINVILIRLWATFSKAKIQAKNCLKSSPQAKNDFLKPWEWHLKG